MQQEKHMSNSTVRMATLEDMDAVLNVCKQFHGEVDWPFEQTVDEEHMRTVYPQLIATDNFMFFMTEDNKAGTAVAVAQDLCTGKLQAQELFWYVDPSERGNSHGKNLYNAMEMWCKVIGVDVLAMIALESLRPELVGRLYKSQGYHLVEHGYMKKLGE